MLGGELSTEAEDPPAHFQGPGDWHACAWHNADGFPLHAGFGKLSQLEDALKRRLLQRAYASLAPGEREAVVESLVRRELDPWRAADQLLGRAAPA